MDNSIQYIKEVKSECSLLHAAKIICAELLYVKKKQ